MREKPLLPWAIAEASGQILAGHCNCMAGLGKTCSHVASPLWAVETGVRRRDSMSVTQGLIGFYHHQWRKCHMLLLAKSTSKARPAHWLHLKSLISQLVCLHRQPHLHPLVIHTRKSSLLENGLFVCFTVSLLRQACNSFSCEELLF